MINLYKKTEKSKDNPRGYIEIQKDSINKPFLFCISAQNNHDKSIFGSIRQGLVATRVYNSKDDGALYKVDNFPIDFIGLRFIGDEKYNNVSNELVNEVIYPYLIKNGTNLNNMILQAKKMNFMTYCDGTATYRNIEKELKNKLNNDGFNSEDINNIFSNINLVAIGTMVDIREFNSSCINVVDVNDDEISNELTIKSLNFMKEKNVDYITGKVNSNCGFCYYNGSGRHSFNEYFKDGVIVKSFIHYIVSKELELSLHNKKCNIEELLNEYYEFIKKGNNQEELLNVLDSSINFNNAPKYTNEELKMRKELDEMCLLYEKNSIKINSLEKSDNSKSERLQNIMNGIKKYSSDTTFYQILVEHGYWQLSNDIDPYSFPSDRDIRQMYENQIQNNEMTR